MGIILVMFGVVAAILMLNFYIVLMLFVIHIPIFTGLRICKCNKQYEWPSFN